MILVVLVDVQVENVHKLIKTWHHILGWGHVVLHLHSGDVDVVEPELVRNRFSCHELIEHRLLAKLEGL